MGNSMSSVQYKSFISFLDTTLPCIYIYYSWVSYFLCCYSQVFRFHYRCLSYSMRIHRVCPALRYDSLIHLFKNPCHFSDRLRILTSPDGCYCHSYSAFLPLASFLVHSGAGTALLQFSPLAPSPATLLSKRNKIDSLRITGHDAASEQVKSEYQENSPAKAKR